MKVKFLRKVRKIGRERLISVPEEIKGILIGERVEIEVCENGMIITKETS